PGGFRGADQVVWVAGAVHRREGPAALVDAPEGVDLVQPVPVPAVAADVGHGREAGDVAVAVPVGNRLEAGAGQRVDAGTVDLGAAASAPLRHSVLLPSSAVCL